MRDWIEKMITLLLDLWKKKFDKMLDENYQLHGWTDQGIPKEETLIKLGLKNIIT